MKQCLNISYLCYVENNWQLTEQNGIAIYSRSSFIMISSILMSAQ